MGYYRCYILDAEDHIVQAHELECETDGAARTTAGDLLGRDPYYRRAELWRAARRIAQLERDVGVFLPSGAAAGPDPGVFGLISERPDL
jgi:hypothetical protein